MKNKYYNADIHMAEEDKLQKFILWDALSKTGETEQMDAEAAAFGVRHTFTIVEKDESGDHFYHFSTNTKNNIINQVYLSNLDLLKQYILFFNDKIRNSKELLKAYNFKFELDTTAAGFTLQDESFDCIQKNRIDLFPKFRTSFSMQQEPSSHTFQAIGSLV